MHPHPALSQALLHELDRERTRVVRSPRPRSARLPRLRAARPRRAARAAAACC